MGEFIPSSNKKETARRTICDEKEVSRLLTPGTKGESPISILPVISLLQSGDQLDSCPLSSGTYSDATWHFMAKHASSSAMSTVGAIAEGLSNADGRARPLLPEWSTLAELFNEGGADVELVDGDARPPPARLWNGEELERVKLLCRIEVA